MNTGLRAEYLKAMGIQQWVARDAAETGGAAAREMDSSGAPDWEALEARVSTCTRCILHESRNRTVFGTGRRDADWLVIGEAPGAEEDRQGEPFVGRAGQLLNEMLLAIGLQRTDVYITNILKCRPPNNRNPLPEEVRCCHDYLQQQIELVDPVLILGVGGVAAKNLLQTDAPVGRLRGRIHRYGERGVPLVVTYHPSYLLRSPLEKRKVWDDLQLARRVYREQLDR